MSKVKIIAVLCLSALILSACGEIAADVSETENGDMITSSDKAVTAAEPTASYETGTAVLEESSSGYSDDSLSLESLKGEKDLYVRVTNYEGKKQIIYYMTDADGTAFAYMDDDVSDPDSHFGYVGMLAVDTPAKLEEFSSDTYKKLLKSGSLNELSTGYNCSEGAFAYSDGIGEIDRDEILRLMGEFEPEYAALGDVSDDDIYAAEEYDESKPLKKISLSDGRNNFSESVSVEFVNYKGHILGRIRYNDFGAVNELIDAAEQPPAEEMLKNAYEKTSESCSDWFYADDSDLYYYTIESILRSENNFVNVDRHEEKDQFILDNTFSDNISEKLNIGASLTGCSEYKLYDSVSISLPDENTMAAAAGNTVLWKNNGISFRLSEEDGYYRYSPDDKEIFYERGSFNGMSCLYFSVERPSDGSRYNELSFRDGNGNYYNASFKADSTADMTEYEKLVKNVLGNIYLIPQENAFADGNEPAPIRLGGVSPYEASERPVIGSVGERYNDVYEEYSPFILCARFYSMDLQNIYETEDFGYSLEKAEADGKWYTVLPVGELVQENTPSREINNAFDSGRIPIVFDSACYPLLPCGKYRIAVPYRKAGTSDKYSGAFYYFTVAPDSGPYVPDVVIGDIKCTDKKVSCSITADELYWVSVYADIEYNENGVWRSVRTSSINTNSLVYPYTLAKNYSYEFSADDYDLSAKGEYRIRVSAAEDNGGEIGGTGTVYGHFTK